MILLKIIITAVATTLMIVVFKNINSSFVPILAIMGGLIIIYDILPYVVELIDILKEVSHFSDDVKLYFNTALKVVIIAIISEFSAQLCTDAGEQYMSSKIYFASKIIMLYQISPIFIQFVKTILTMVQQL